MTTPSSYMTPMDRGRVWLSMNIPDLQGRGQHLGSRFHGEALITALVAATIDSMSRAMGPMTEGTCTWPSVDTETPWYGRRVLCARESVSQEYPDKRYSGARKVEEKVETQELGSSRGFNAYTWLQPVKTQHVTWDADASTYVRSPPDYGSFQR